VQFADKRHATDEVLEMYSMDRLAGLKLVEFEEHLLVCNSCQDRLAREDSIRQRVCDGAAVLQRPPVAASWRLPKLGWAAGLVAAGLLVFAGFGWQSFRRSAMAPAAIVLETTRGAEDATLAAAPAGRPLALILELTGLEAHSEYRLEVVDAGGQPVFQSHGAPQNNKLIATLAKGLRAGSYFVRVYANTGELLREYALTVRG
jgi:hypothetical protein